MARGTRTFSRFSRKSKFEEAISAVEQGLVFQFDQIHQEWPSDLHSQKRALSAVLDHLNAGRVPKIRVAHNEAMDKESAQLTFLCNAAFAVVNGVLDRMPDMPENHVRELFALLRVHFPDLKAWLSFLAHDILLVPTDQANPRVGSRAAANFLKRLLEKGNMKYLKDDTDAMEEFVHIVLAVWLGSVPDYDEEPDTIDLDKETYRRSVVPLSDMLWNCLLNEPARGIALNQIAKHRKSWHVQLAHSLTYRCQQWARIYADADDPMEDCKVFIGCALMSQILSDSIPAFAKVLAKSSFPSAVMEAAMEFPLESGQSDLVALPVQIGQLMLAFRPSDIYEQRKVMPEIFEAGLMKVIVSQLLSPRATLEKPFPDWLGCDPLLKISTLCFLPEMTYALSWGIVELSDKILEALWTDPIARKRWRPFFRAVTAYRQAYEQRVEEDSDGEPYDEDCIESITLCDNIDHAEADGRHMILVDSVQCSWCHVVTYCSEECQRHDWKKLHREECSRDRVYRIDRQLNGAWISHINRMRICRVHELFLQKAIPVIASLPPSAPGCPTGKAALFMDHSTLPLSMKLLDMQCFRSLTHDGGRIYGDKRSELLIKRYEEDQTDKVRLTGGIAPHGQYLVVVLCSFTIERESGERSGRSGFGESSGDDSGDNSDTEAGDSDSERLPELVLANGYIRILDVVNPDGIFEMEIHRGVTGIASLSFEPPDESDAYDSD